MQTKKRYPIINTSGQTFFVVYLTISAGRVKTINAKALICIMNITNQAVKSY